MFLNSNETTTETLTLRGRMSELTRVSPWIERLAKKYAIPQKTEFAMNLCLEEVLSNIIRHGYSGDSDHFISVHFDTHKGDYLVFVVDDHAPPFNPVDAPELPPINLLDNIQIGGQGIRLLRRFADTLEYSSIPTGNRLTIGFAASSALARD